MDTLRSFKHCGAKGITKLILHPRRNRIVKMTNTQKEKVEKDDSEKHRKIAAVPLCCWSCTVLVKTQQLMLPILLCIRTILKVTLNLAKYVGALQHITRVSYFFTIVLEKPVSYIIIV